MQMSSTYLQGDGHFLVQPRLDLLYFFITPAKHFAEIKWKPLISEVRGQKVLITELSCTEFKQYAVQVIALPSKISRLPFLFS